MSTVHKLRDSAKPSKIWYTRCPLPAASGIAQRQRWLHQSFAPFGIEVETIRTSTDRNVRDSHFTHLQPALFREGGPVPPIWARSLGRETALVGITRTDEARAILVRSDSDLVSVADVRGRKIALPRHQTQYADHARAHTLFGFTRSLNAAGLTTDDVHFIDIVEDEYEIREPPVAVGQTQFPVLDALLDGRVDGIHAASSRVGRFISKHGLRPLRTTADPTSPTVTIAPGTPRAVTVNKDLASEYPEIVGRYLAVMLQVAEWAERNQAAGLQVLGAELGLTEAELAAGHGPNVHSQLYVRLTPDYQQALQEQKRFLFKNGFIQQDFDFAAWVDPGPLEIAEQIIREKDLLVAV